MLRLFHIVLVLGNRVKILKLPLYSIQFLHQITTITGSPGSFDELYSIQFLHQITTFLPLFLSAAELYSIQFLHQITTGPLMPNLIASCIVFNFYIKSQHSLWLYVCRFCCIVFNFYIKSQQVRHRLVTRPCCIVFNFYIKSQPQALHLLIIRVLRPYVPRKKRCSAN